MGYRAADAEVRLEATQAIEHRSGGRNCCAATALRGLGGVAPPHR